MDGWNENKVEDLLRVLDDCQQLQYELNNCRRGVYSNAETYAELSEYAKGLAKRLLTQAEYLADVEEDEEGEDYE